MALTTSSSRWLRRNRLLILVLLVSATASVTLLAHANFSLIASFRAVWDGGGCVGGAVTDGVCSDGLPGVSEDGTYRDLQEGMEVYSNDVGNVVVNATNSHNRRICVDFPANPTHIHDQAYFDRFVGSRPLDGCYPGAFNTLANGEYGATDVGFTVSSPRPISAWIYFFVDGIQYELQWKRQGYGSIESFGPPLKVSYSATPDRWTLEPFRRDEISAYQSDTCPNCKYDDACPEGCTTLMVFSNKQPRGRIALANYVMPLQIVAERDPVNRRQTKGKK